MQRRLTELSARQFPNLLPAVYTPALTDHDGRTLMFPTPERTARPGAFASMGLGVNHAR
ncbi:hypothetical protein GTZ93_38220 [Corallococcus exiguus]|uniref:Uncharacterized protein n=1 Tax=Corallococcus exiguus TaxID=83462 RepID=A0A7X5BVW9_9BACT|nr:hypothetical protein [Corallococcus exiguus]